MFHLIRNTELEITLDMTGVDENVPSVAFDISIKWNMLFQKANIEINECWFDCKEFDFFESSLIALIEEEKGTISLLDLSRSPVLSLTKENLKLTAEISFQDTLGTGSFNLKTTGNAVELSEIRDKLKEFDRWW